MAPDADALMRNFIEAGDASGESSLAELLSTYAQPQVRRMISQRFAAAGVAERQDIDDLCSEVLAELLYRLRQIKDNPADAAIDNFSSYAAAATYRAYSDYLRRKYPQRHRLKTQLRYLLQTDKRFEIWSTPGHLWLCGLARWGDSFRHLRKTQTLEEVQQIFAELSKGKPAGHPGDFVLNLLNRLAAPVELNDLVGLVAELWGIRDHASLELEEGTIAHTQSGPAPSQNLELQQWLAHLWREVSCLPVPQRHALLLNLREEGGGSALLLVPLSGIASIRDIAELLQMPVAELASLWKHLPLDDLKLSLRLGTTRQQVINLRKSARARLTRRMAESRHGW